LKVDNGVITDPPLHLEAKPMRIHSVTISVPNPQETAAFFWEKLDLPMTETNGAVQVQVGASTLLLEQGDPDPEGYYHLAFEIPENTIIPARDLLHSRTAILPAGDDGIITASEAWNAHSVYFNAPGNLNLELIARHRKHNAISTPFKFGDIQYISEVGIPVEDTARATGQIKQAFGLDPFTPPSDEFAPVGTDDGLLIVVRSGRTWFPTESQKTTSRPLTITIEGVPTSLNLTPHITIRGMNEPKAGAPET
jgi:catechol-2,3-dioxygenase